MRQRVGDAWPLSGAPLPLWAGPAADTPNVEEYEFFAAAVGRTLATVPASRGAAIAIRGPWGSGKSTVAQSCVEEALNLGQAYVVDLNVWLTDSAGERISDVAADLISCCDARLADVARSFQRYSRRALAIDSLVNRHAYGWSAGLYLAEVTALLLQHVLGCALERRLKVLTCPLILVVDDIDRTAPDRHASAFKLIRLTSHLPNIRYLVLFDSSVVGPRDLGEVRHRYRLRRPLQLIYDLPTTLRRRPEAARSGRPLIRGPSCVA